MPLIRRTSESTPPPDTFSDADLSSPSAATRWSAARAAGPQSVGALAQALAKEPEPRVREAIFTTLARIGTPASVEALTPFIRSPDASLRTGALDALGSQPLVTATYFGRLLADPDHDVRILACELGRAIKASEARERLLSLIEAEKDPNVCAAAIEVLAEVGDAAALPVLERCAGRFPDNPFLAFAVRITSERLAERTGFD